MGNEVLERKIKRLFDFQRFIGDPELDKVIEDTESGINNIVKLSDYDLELVAAGVGQEPPVIKNDEIQ